MQISKDDLKEFAKTIVKELLKEIKPDRQVGKEIKRFNRKRKGVTFAQEIILKLIGDRKESLTASELQTESLDLFDVKERTFYTALVKLRDKKIIDYHKETKVYYMIREKKFVRDMRISRRF